MSCPVTALSLLFTRYPTKSPSDPLFSRTFGPFNQSWVLHRPHTLLLAAGIDPSHYSGHSFRRGAANTAATLGIPKDAIMELGRWKSDAINRYFSAATTQSNLLTLSQQLHSHPGPSSSASVPLLNLLNKSQAFNL